MMQIDSEDNYVETHPGRVEFDEDNTGAPRLSSEDGCYSSCFTLWRI